VQLEERRGGLSDELGEDDVEALLLGLKLPNVAPAEK
jgi:hypothetical protein